MNKVIYTFQPDVISFLQAVFHWLHFLFFVPRGLREIRAALEKLVAWREAAWRPL